MDPKSPNAREPAHLRSKEREKEQQQMRLTVRCVSRLFIPSVSLVRFQAHHLPRAWAYRGRSLGKDWRFLCKLRARGAESAARTVGDEEDAGEHRQPERDSPALCGGHHTTMPESARVDRPGRPSGP